MAAAHWSTRGETSDEDDGDGDGIGNREEGTGDQESVPGDGKKNSMLVPAGFDPADVAAGLVGDGSDEGPADSVSAESCLLGKFAGGWRRTDENALDALLPGALARVPGGTETIFWRLHGGGDGASRVVDAPDGVARDATRSEASVDTFWLDSATAADGSGRCPRSRFSFMGGAAARSGDARCTNSPTPRAPGTVTGTETGTETGTGRSIATPRREVGFPGVDWR